MYYWLLVGILTYSCAELSLMFNLLDRIDKGVEPMLQHLESYIVQSGIDDMKSCAEIITSVSR